MPAGGDQDSVIVTRGLTKAFGRRRAVDGLSLEVGRGEIFGFLGPNGAGKSTTIRMLLGLVAPTAGEAFVAGHSILADRARALRCVGAIVDAPCFHDHLTARKNLELAQRLYGLHDPARVDELLARVRLDGRADDAVKTFSHGMKQRLGIARALLHRPEVVILDEPSDGLDPRGRREMRDIILEIARGLSITVLLSSHLLNEMEVLCDRVAIIHGGRLLFQGELARLREREGGGGELVLDVDRPGEALAALRGDEAVAGVEEGAPLRVRLRPGAGAGGLNRRLLAAGFEVRALSPVEPSLEDLFLRLTAEAPC